MSIQRARIERLCSELIDAMCVEFPAAEQSTNAFELPRFTIPPLVSEFGPLVAEIDPIDGLTLIVGQLTHTRFDGDSAVDELITTCRDIMADKIVIASLAYGASMSPRENADFTEEGEFWVWSGRLNPPKKSTE